MLENSQHMQQLLSKIGNTYVNDVTSQGVSMATPSMAGGGHRNPFIAGNDGPSSITLMKEGVRPIKRKKKGLQVYRTKRKSRLLLFPILS